MQFAGTGTELMMTKSNTTLSLLIGLAIAKCFILPEDFDAVRA